MDKEIPRMQIHKISFTLIREITIVWYAVTWYSRSTKKVCENKIVRDSWTNVCNNDVK